MRQISAVLLSILTLMNLMAVAEADVVAEGQYLAAQSIRRNLPMKVDELTTWLAAVSAGRNLTYTYRMDIQKRELPSNWYREQKSLLRSNVCHEPTMRKLINLGANYSYVYMDIGGKHILSVNIEKSDC